jgi:hypothetical protein
MSWAAVAVAYVLSPAPVLLAPAVLVAAGFSLLLVGHMVAAAAQTAPVRDVAPPGEAGSTTKRFVLGRRAFSSGVARAGLGAVLAAIFGYKLFGRPPAVEAAACENPALHDTSMAAGNGLGPVDICADDQASAEKASAEKAAATEFVKPAKAFADSFCGAFLDCTGGKCVRKEGTGNLVFTVSCAQVNDPQGKCKKKKRFTCTGKVTGVGCTCKKPISGTRTPGRSQ